MSKQRTFNLIHSVNWHCRPSDLNGLPLELQEATRRMCAETPLCCELTNRAFCRLLIQTAHGLGFHVKRWPLADAAGCQELVEAAKRGELKDTTAMMLHSWHGDYEKECVPSWDFYPLLEALRRCSTVVYPSPELDELHSAKRYQSKFMPPTQFLTLRRHGNLWKANGQAVAKALQLALKELRKDALKAGLDTVNIMLKQGFSWGGAQVTRLRPREVHHFVMTRVIPKIPEKATELTLLLQAKVELVAELRWMVLEGQLRGCGWVTLPVPRLGRRANSGCYKNEQACRKALEKLNLDRLELESSIRDKVQAVVQEATIDAGKVPLYLRVDFLVDKQGRAWLGERESWGADLVRNQENPLGRTNPTRAELARAMLKTPNGP